MDIKTFKIVAPSLPSDIAVLMRGPTGVGKSHLAKAIADQLGLPFIDVRGSTMSEGDVGGYPDIEGMKESGVMTFCMPSWFMRACSEPVVLMLDELNRSSGPRALEWRTATSRRRARPTRQRASNQIVGLVRRRSNHLATKALKL